MKKLKYLLMACCAACVWLAACSDDDYEPLPDWWWEQTGEPAVYPEPEPVDNKVVAHRGCYAETGFPQNSVAGLKKAVEMKLFASECDIHLTKDGKVVVYHDDYYLGNTCFKDATYAELCAKGTLANGEKLPLLEEFIDVVLEGGCTQLWIDVKTLGDEAGGKAEASRTGIAAAQIVHEKRAKNFVGFIVGRLAIRDKVIPAVRSAWPVSYGAAAYEPGDFIARDIPWANMKLADFGLDTKRAKSFPENKVRLSLWQIDTDEQMQWYQGIRSDVYGITNYPLRMMDKLGLR